MHRNYRKPLIISAPKVGLKHPKAYSPIEDMISGTVFLPTITKEYGKGKSGKVILCSGKIAFDIEAKLESIELKNRIKVVRVEELAPFPTARVREQL